MESRIEDERKFLATEIFRGDLANGVEITQGYLSVDPPIRVRIENPGDSFLTIKIKQAPGINLEFEERLPLDLAQQLMSAHKYCRIRKTRYKRQGLEIDIFYGELAGLVLVEFEQKDGAKLVMPSRWVVEEVTGDPRFENHNLCQLDKVPEEWRCQIVPRSL